MTQLSVKVDRWKYLGGSDIPIIMNLSGFKTRWKLLKEKAQIEEPEEVSNKYIDYGNEMEGKIRDYVNEELGFDFVEGKHYLTFEGTDVRLHTDGEDLNKKTILEIKTTSQIENDVFGYKHYIVQLLFYMKMLGVENGVLAVYDRPEDFSTELDPTRLQIFPINDGGKFADIVAEVVRSIRLFVADLEKLKENPFLEQSDLLTGDETELLNRLIELKVQEDERKEEKKAIEKKLSELMIENGHKTVDGFGWKVTNVLPTEAHEVEKVSFDLEALKADHPRIYKKYATVTKEVAKEKAGFVKLTKMKEKGDGGS